MRQRLGVAGCYRSFADHSKDVIREFAAPLVLGDEHIDISRRRAAGLPDRRENMRLFEFLLVIVLAEGAKHHCRATEQIGIEARGLCPQFRGHVTIDENGAANDTMFAHQVFDRALTSFSSSCFSAARAIWG